MKNVLRACALLTGVFFASATAASGQATSQEPAAPQSLRVVLHCPDCDTAFLKSSLAFVEFVAEDTNAEVDVTVSAPAGTENSWRLAFAGRGRFAGRNRAVAFPGSGPAATEETRRELVRYLKLGLAEYAVETGAGPQLDVTFKRPAGAAATPTTQRDSWNYWIFRLGVDSYGNGEQSTVSRSFYFNASARRTTDNWKVQIGGYRSLDKNSFDLGDGETVKSRLSSWGSDSLVVKSLTGHWSLGLTASLSGSTFSNEELVGQFAVGPEYDIFPYAESTKRSLTIQYTAGPAFYDYEAETIYGKLTERIVKHSLITSLGLSQPWGQAGGTFAFSQQISEPDRTRLSVSGGLSVRLTKGLTVNGSGSYDRIRDQFTLEKGVASEEEVLLRQRQLATGHRYRFSVGFAFSFGALSNAIVNPRFSL